MFSTKANTTTKDNIANVFGAKTLPALVPLELQLELQPTTSVVLTNIHTENISRNVKIVGHISRPVFGEGRQTPDRQMFFVNSRPCGLPQISKAFNEVYKSFNVTQSPFIFANLLMDTNSYDVNVSPDKRTILLHDQIQLLESIKEALMNMFEAQDQTVPQSQLAVKKLPAFRPLSFDREASGDADIGVNLHSRIQRTPLIVPSSDLTVDSSTSQEPTSHDGLPPDLISRFAARNHELRRSASHQDKSAQNGNNNPSSKAKQNLAGVADQTTSKSEVGANIPSGQSFDSIANDDDEVEEITLPALPKPVQDFNARLASQQAKSAHKTTDAMDSNFQHHSLSDEDIPSISPSPRKVTMSVVDSAYERSRPKRSMIETATITVGDRTTTAIIGSSSHSMKRRRVEKTQLGRTNSHRTESSQFALKMRAFTGPGSQVQASEPDNEDGSGADEEKSDAEEDDSKAVSQPDTITSSADGVESDVDDQDDDGKIQEPDEESDDEYVDEAEKKKIEEARVNQLIAEAEAAAAQPTEANQKRAANLLKSQMHKESTLNLVRFIRTSSAEIEEEADQLNIQIRAYTWHRRASQSILTNPLSTNTTPEERLSLTIARSDFASMSIIGQFNLGFILATRASSTTNNLQASPSSTDLFIIDQHASDEIYNFTRLSKTTSLTPQPLVHPHPLSLTAIEEETILSHTATLSKNGFHISLDDSGDLPVGSRCKLLTLPTSRDTVFDTRDLEELIALLGENGGTSAAGGEVARPTRVRRMLAMRACRSSIMVGKTLTAKGMAEVVRHMGEIERPWNCPHGRPTMRHLAGLGEWEGWLEGRGLVGDEGGTSVGESTDWKGFVARARDSGLLDDVVGGAGAGVEEDANANADDKDKDDSVDGGRQPPSSESDSNLQGQLDDGAEEDEAGREESAE